MKIVDIFASGALFSVHYEGVKYNEYRRLMMYWNDIEEISNFLKSNVNDIPPKRYEASYSLFAS